MMAVVVWVTIGILALFLPGVIAVIAEDWRKTRKIDLYFLMVATMIMLIVGWAINIAYTY
jgi:hypothetical protein